MTCLYNCCNVRSDQSVEREEEEEERGSMQRAGAAAGPVVDALRGGTCRAEYIYSLKGKPRTGRI